MIRPATVADIPQLLELGAAMHAEAPNFAALPFDASRLEASLVAMIGDGDTLVAVAERHGALVGVLLAICGMHWASTAIEVDELALYVAPDARGTLVAAQLIATLKQYAFDRDAKIIRAGAAAGVNNDLVVSLYERAGFRVIGTDLQFIVKE